jgi:hypothetical protein
VNDAEGDGTASSRHKGAALTRAPDRTRPSLGAQWDVVRYKSHAGLCSERQPVAGCPRDGASTNGLDQISWL